MTNPNPSFKKNTLAGLSVPTNIDPNIKRFLDAVKQHLELAHGNKGQPKSRFATLDDLKAAGLVDIKTVRGRGEIVQIASTTGAKAKAAGATGVVQLGDLVDVAFAGSIVGGQVLTFNAATSKWGALDLPGFGANIGYPAALGYAGI